MTGNRKGRPQKPNKNFPEKSKSCKKHVQCKRYKDTNRNRRNSKLAHDQSSFEHSQHRRTTQETTCESQSSTITYDIIDTRENLSDRYMLKPRLTASKRCARWLASIKPDVGTKVKAWKQKDSKRKKRLQLKAKRSHSQPLPVAKHTDEQLNNPLVSAKQGGYCHRGNFPPMDEIYARRWEKKNRQPPICRVVPKAKSCGRFKRWKCPAWKNLPYPKHCRKCLKKRWQGGLDRTRPNNDYAYYKKHRTGNYVTKKQYRSPTSLGWAILQVIKRLGKKRAYPLAILEVLKKKWDFPTLNLLGLNNALRWMEQRKLLFCKVRMNRHYPKFRVETGGDVVLCKRIKQCKNEEKFCPNYPCKRPRIVFKSKLPNTISVKTQWREKLRKW